MAAARSRFDTRNWTGGNTAEQAAIAAPNPRLIMAVVAVGMIVGALLAPPKADHSISMAASAAGTSISAHE